MSKKEYSAPIVRVVGSLQELTLADKNLTKTPDGFLFFGLTLTT
jgi:hypothetical protein